MQNNNINKLYVAAFLNTVYKVLWFSYSFSHAYYCIIRWDKGMIHMSLGRQNVLMPCYAHWISETLSLISVFHKAHLKIRPCVIMQAKRNGWGGGGEGILFCCTYSRHAVKSSLIWRFCTDVGKAAAKRLWEALVGKCATQFLAETVTPQLMQLSPKKPLYHAASTLTCCMSCLLLKRLLDSYIVKLI